jgi:hypothetical protein
MTGISNGGGQNLHVRFTLEHPRDRDAIEGRVVDDESANQASQIVAADGHEPLAPLFSAETIRLTLK